MKDDDRIRHVETTLLDREHLKSSVFNLSHKGAAIRLLKMFGDVTRDMAPHWSVRDCSWLIRSLTHCLRWAHELCPEEAIVDEPHWKTQDDHALKLLMWGMKYAKLFNDHVAWSRELIPAKIDERARKITFGERGGSFAFVIEQQIRDERELASGADEVSEAIDVIFQRWYPRMRWNTVEGLVYPFDLIGSLKELEPIKAWCQNLILPELSDSELLGKYSVGELRQLYACTYALCACVARLEDLADKTFGEEHLMGSWIHVALLADMIEWFCICTGVRREAVEAIVCDYTLDLRRTHCSLLSTPLVLTRCGNVLFSPRLFSMAHPQRTILSALTIGSGRTAYDRVSEKVEQWWVEYIARALRACGQTVVAGPKLRFSKGVRTPDLVVLDESCSVVYIVEFKNYVPPLDVGAVCNRLVEFSKGVKQIQEYVELARNCPAPLERAVQRPLEGFEIKGILLLRHPMPLPIKPPVDVLLVDWPSVRDSLEKGRGTTFSEVLRQAEPKRAEPLEFGEQVILVQGWKYVRVLPVRA